MLEDERQPPRPSDRQISKQLGRRPLTPRQRQVLEIMRNGRTQFQNYLTLLDTDPSWGKVQGPYGIYELTFPNFRQHLINAMGRLQAHSTEEALRIYQETEDA